MSVRQINVDKLSLKELIELELKVQSAIGATRERERVELKDKIEALLEGSGFTIDELFARGRGAMKGRTIAAKYVNPDNRLETWTGRGRKPKWLVAKLKKGASMAEFAI